MSFSISEYIKLPTVLKLGGAVIFGLTIWKGVHGFLPSFGLIAGAGMAYVGKHFDSIYN